MLALCWVFFLGSDNMGNIDEGWGYLMPKCDFV
jgi:hypothetical protein